MTERGARLPTANHETGSGADEVQPEGTTETGQKRRFSAISSLYERNYVLLLIGNGLAHAGEQMEHVARSWLVFELTDSVLALGIVTFTSGLPRLFLSMVAGVLADRLDRRGLMFLCNIVELVAAFVFATLVFTNLIDVWQILVIVFVTSIFSTMNLVTRQAIIPEIVPRRDVGNAIALHSTLRGTTQIVAQSLAGLLIAFIGVAGVLYVHSAAYLAMLIALLMMRMPRGPARTEALAFRQHLGEGFRYVWGRADLLALVLVALLPMVLIHPYRTLMPVFARDVLKVGPEGYGVLMAAPGLGAILAAAGIAALNPSRHGLIMLSSLVLTSAALISFALASSFAAALASLVLVGLAFNVYRIANSTLLQLLTPRRMMGRVMGMYHADRGLLPVGSLALGALATILNAPLAVTLGAAVCGLLSLGLFTFRPLLDPQTRPVSGSSAGDESRAKGCG